MDGFGTRRRAAAAESCVVAAGWIWDRNKLGLGPKQECANLNSHILELRVVRFEFTKTEIKGKPI
jgi:hypothetical protein